MPESEADLLTWVALHTAEVRFDESMAGLIASVLDEGPRGRPEWWIVTDLVNPIAAYHRRRYPKLEPPPEIQLRLDYGKRMHDTAREWFRQLPGFVSVEGRVDGAAVDMPRLKGKIDFRTGRVIIEFKTTQFVHDTSASVLDKTPQDLEQLLIYAILSDREDGEHRLVYFNRAVDGNPFRTFKVRILRPGPVKQFFRARLSALEFAHRQDDPGSMGRCRYFDTGCAFAISQKCDCSGRSRIDTRELEANVRIERDSEYEDRLASIWDQPALQRSPGIRIWDLFTPRRAVVRLGAEETSFRPDENYVRRRQQEESFITSDLCGGTFDVTLAGREEAGVPLVGRGITVRLRESTSDGFNETTLPVLIRVSNGRPPEDPRQISDAYKAQLGALCAIRGAPRGLVVVTYPQSDDAMQCYLARFDNLGEIRARLGESLGSIRTAIRRGQVTDLPKCPDWIQRRCDVNCFCLDPTGP